MLVSDKTLSEQLLETFSDTVENKESLKGNVYCDMDGVLCDFDKRFEYLTGKTPKEYKDTYNIYMFWNLINNKIGEQFWSKMPWTDNGPRLWNFIKNYDPKILTTPSEDKSSKRGKLEWVQENIGSGTKVLFSNKKYRYSNKGRLLIDDRESNCEGWTRNGGISICYKDNNIETVIDTIKKI